MAKIFTYKAKDRGGHVLTGSILADNQAAVAAFVRSKGYFVMKITEDAGESTIQVFLDRFTPVKTKDLAVFCRQFATMIDAGMPLISSLSVLVEQTSNPNLKRSLQAVYKQVQEGQMLARVMEDHKHVFPTIMIKMIGAGEVGGVLDDVLNRLAVQLEKEYKLNAKVKSAMTYPAVVVAMMVIAVTAILVFVLPTFVGMFQGMNMQLPLPTRILLAASDFIRANALILIAGVLAAGYGLKLALNRQWVKALVDNLILFLPIFGDLWRKVSIARFSRMLSTLLRGGVAITTALEVVKQTMTDSNMTKAITVAQTSVQEGVGLAAPLGASPIFLPMVVQMVAIGEETGELDKMLEKVADFYESDVDDIVSRLSSILEPVLIGVLGVVVGGMIVAIMLPMFDIMTAVPK